MKTTTDILRTAAREFPASMLDAEARHIARVRSVSEPAAVRFATLESRIDARDGPATAAELAEIAGLIREIDGPSAVVAR